jgi:hypothetical protein
MKMRRKDWKNWKGGGRGGDTRGGGCASCLVTGVGGYVSEW